MRRSIALLLICSFIGSFRGLYAHIDAAVEMQLVGNRTVLVAFDAYQGSSLERNQVNAAVIAMAIKNMARDNPDKKIVFSYEDPAVYDVGNLLKSNLTLLSPYLDRSDVQMKYFSLLPSPKKAGHYDVMALAKPPKLTTFLAGDLTRALTLIPELPHNLTVSSNDPRHEHYLAIVKDQTWVMRYAKNIRMKHLITASPLLAAKRIIFTVDHSLTTSQQDKLQSLMTQFKAIEDQQLDGFANFSSLRAGQPITVKDLGQSVNALKNKISLNTVYEFLMQAKQRADVYSDGPVIDALLTMFNRQHPDIMVIILGNHLAKKLIEHLRDLDVIESGHDIPNALEYFTKMAMKNN